MCRSRPVCVSVSGVKTQCSFVLVRFFFFNKKNKNAVRKCRKPTKDWRAPVQSDDFYRRRLSIKSDWMADSTTRRKTNGQVWRLLAPFSFSLSLSFARRHKSIESKGVERKKKKRHTQSLCLKWKEEWRKDLYIGSTLFLIWFRFSSRHFPALDVGSSAVNLCSACVKLVRRHWQLGLTSVSEALSRISVVVFVPPSHALISLAFWCHFLSIDTTTNNRTKEKTQIIEPTDCADVW